MSAYTSATDADRREMLAAIGVETIEELFADIPESLRLGRALKLDAPRSEQEVYDDSASRNPLGRAGEHSELANLASFLISDEAGYINGEMVVQDGGAHLRSSGAEDLLQWTEAQWAELRASRTKG